MSIIFTIFIILVVLAIGVNVFAFFYEKKYNRKLQELAKTSNINPDNK